MNKPACLGLSILELSNINVLGILMYINVSVLVWLCKTKIWRKNKLCYMDTDSFIVYIEIDDIHKDTAEKVENRFDASNYELERPIPKEKTKKVIGLMKD